MTRTGARLPLMLVVALIVACDGGAPVKPTQPVHMTSIDTLRPGQLAHVRGSGLTNLRSLLLDPAALNGTSLDDGAHDAVRRRDDPLVADFRRPSGAVSRA